MLGRKGAKIFPVQFFQDSNLQTPNGLVGDDILALVELGHNKLGHIFPGELLKRKDRFNRFVNDRFYRFKRNHPQPDSSSSESSLCRAISLRLNDRLFPLSGR